MTILVDDAIEGRILRFRHPERIIVAHMPSELGSALEELEAARTSGRYLAGWFAYDLGYALEPRLAPYFWRRLGTTTSLLDLCDLAAPRR